MHDYGIVKMWQNFRSVEEKKSYVARVLVQKLQAVVVFPGGTIRTGQDEFPSVTLFQFEL